MAIQHTRWSPDTCACVIDYQWDDAVAPEVRVHSAGAIVSQCSAHAGQSLIAHFTTLMDENPRKNLAIDAVMKQVTTLVYADFTFAYDAARVLDITCPKLTTAQKTAAQTAADTKFGVGKVLFL